jgi:hypothetical protein
LLLWCLLAPAIAIDPWSNPVPTEVTSGLAAYFQGSAFTGNTVVPAQEILHPKTWGRDYSPTDGNNIGVASARVEAGAKLHGYRVGIVVREDWFASATRAALDLFKQSQTGIVPPGRPQQAYYQVRGWSGYGLQAGKQARWSLPQSRWAMSAGVTLNLLEGRQFHREDWFGSFVPLASGVVLTNGIVTRNDDNLHKNLFRGPIPAGGHPWGEGYSTDFTLSAVHPIGYRLDWTVADVFSLMRWKHIPSETFVADNYIACQRLTVACADAKLSHTDLARGVVVPRDFSVHINSKQTFTVTAPVQQVVLFMHDSYGYGVHLPGLGLRYPAGASWSVGTDYDVRFHSLALDGRYRALYASCETNSFVLSRAKVVGLALGFRLAL